MRWQRGEQVNRREGKTGRQGSQSGATLIPVIFIIVILAFIGVMFVSLINTGSLTSVNDLQAARALYVAEGGGEYVLVNRVFPNYSTGGATINLGEGSFSVATPAYLTAALTAVATTVTVNSTTGFPGAGRITIDDEQINYTGTTATTFTGCTRAQGGTTAAAHASGNAVYPATTVTAALTAAATTITVGSTTGFLVPGVVRIDSEFIYCANRTATTFTGCIRGYKNTVAVAHTAGTSTTVFQYIITSTGTVGNAQRIVRASVTSAPVFRTAGTAVSGTGAVSPTWPAAHAINDIALLFIESCGGEAATLSSPAGFVAVTNSPQATGAGILGTRITVYWARATSTAMAAPTVADPGNHVYAQIITYRGVINTGNPWNITGGGVQTPASTSVTVTGVTTTGPNKLIVQAVARDNDSAAAAFSAQTNANLQNITERSDAGTTSGNGGGFAVWGGVLETGSATGNTTATVTSSINAFLTIALLPPAGRILDWREGN
jgi:Tfp pilus assembly protein PilX